MLGFVPMPHEVEIQKAYPELDEWGYAVVDESQESQKVKAKITYNSLNEEITVASGQTIRYTASILLEGVPDVEYEDFITWTDTRGNVHSKQPVEIAYKHDLSGNPIAVRVTV